MESQILASVIRGETVESVHRGHLIVLDGGGNTVVSIGDPETVTFFRSACKPIQAIPLITTGAADHFGFSEDEIALACASHSGETIHVEIAARMLEKIGLAESDLRCGAHLPFNEKVAEQILRSGGEPSQLHNNCSGKHAGMLAAAKQLGADAGNYESCGHPVQAAILDAIAEFAGVPKESIAIGIDGCAVPNFAMPLSAMATSFLNLINPPERFDPPLRSACIRIVNAMIEHPALIGGTERLDTMLMQAAPAKLISKVGAEGVWLCGVLPSDKWPNSLTIALKIEDGDDKRARPVVAVEILRRLGVLSEDGLADLSPLTVKNRRGDIVGRVEADVTMPIGYFFKDR